RPDPVLDRSARIHEFGLAVHRRADPLGYPRQPDERCPTDDVEHRRIGPAMGLPRQVRAISGVAHGTMPPALSALGRLNCTGSRTHVATAESACRAGSKWR